MSDQSNLIIADRLTEPPVAPTGFDFTRRDSLSVALRDIPTLLQETIEWIKSEPFQKPEPAE